MNAGGELDEIIGEQVMGWERKVTDGGFQAWWRDGVEVVRMSEWQPSTGMADAGQVLHRYTELFPGRLMVVNHHAERWGEPAAIVEIDVPDNWRCWDRYVRAGVCEWERNGDRLFVYGTAVPHAICLAAWKAVDGGAVMWPYRQLLEWVSAADNAIGP